MRNSGIATLADFEGARVCEQRHLRRISMAKCHIGDVALVTVVFGFDAIKKTNDLRSCFELKHVVGIQ